MLVEVHPDHSEFLKSTSGNTDDLVAFCINNAPKKHLKRSESVEDELGVQEDEEIHKLERKYSNPVIFFIFLCFSLMLSHMAHKKIGARKSNEKINRK